MKKKLLLLGILATQSGFSQCAETCCCNIAELPKCINCECYTPKYYHLNCDWGLFVTGDFLYWYAKETNLNYAVEYSTNVLPAIPSASSSTSSSIAFASHFFYLNANWKPGFRVGVGFNTSSDGWDIYANWTNYHNEKKGSQTTSTFNSFFPLNAGNVFLEDPWFDGPVFFNLVSAKWNFHFNDVDLELGRRYWLSRYFTLRPFAGLRGAWTKTTFRLHDEFDGTLTSTNSSTGTTTSLSPFIVNERFNNRFWGIGLLGGLQPTWYFSNCFSLFGNVDVALLWGEYKWSKKTSLETIITIMQTSASTGFDVGLFPASKSKYFQLQPVIDIGLGLRYETTFCQNSYQFSLDAGWEHHHWFNLNQRYKVFEQTTSTTSTIIPIPTNSVTGTAFAGANETQHDVGFGGFVLRARFDF